MYNIKRTYAKINNKAFKKNLKEKIPKKTVSNKKAILFGSFLLIATPIIYANYNYLKKPIKHLENGQYVNVSKINNLYNKNIVKKEYFNEYCITFTIDSESVNDIDKIVNYIITEVEEQTEIIIKIESYGGSTTLYFFAYEQLKRLKSKYKLLTFVDKKATSGGYALATIGDTLYTINSASLGSIGVISEYSFDDIEYLKKEKEKGVKNYLIFSGNHKNINSSLGEFTEENKKEEQRRVDEIHKQFKNIVSENRKNIKDINELATGVTFNGEECIKNGLADEIRLSDDYLQYVSKEKNVYEVKYNINEKNCVSKKSSLENIKDYLKNLLDEIGL